MQLFFKGGGDIGSFGFCLVPFDSLSKFKRFTTITFLNFNVHSGPGLGGWFGAGLLASVARSIQVQPSTHCTFRSPCTHCSPWTPSSSLPGQLRIDTSSSSHNVSALVGKRAVLSCTVRNLNNHSVRIFYPPVLFIRHRMELNFQQNLHFATLALKSLGGG